jgi:DNA (cytosine-5)-methyltransferase 1
LVYHKIGKEFEYGIVTEESKYTNTISARYYKDGSEILIQQKGCNPRELTPREAARLQGFPENFKIPVSNTQTYRQFGNSVPVKVIEKIAEQMLLHLEKGIISSHSCILMLLGYQYHQYNQQYCAL